MPLIEDPNHCSICRSRQDKINAGIFMLALIVVGLLAMAAAVWGPHK